MAQVNGWEVGNQRWWTTAPTTAAPATGIQRNPTEDSSAPPTAVPTEVPRYMAKLFQAGTDPLSAGTAATSRDWWVGGQGYAVAANRPRDASSSRWLMISGGGLTKRLTRLEERDLVTRRLAPGDRRSLLVALTAQGRSLAESAVRAHSAATADLVDRIGPRSRERLSTLLRDLLLSLDPDPATTPATSTG
ncbi:hypothetical protein L6E12_00760 [Actinokineospora sp. PR83]|uniref:MarR family winged helix-turn-helix transcriptional regulator n=1 Tax=Actinokineospora sp. PR83 TaxID=2884908 RepID=UPI001F3128DB|nr:hypothetical protein [Actinokineospora sp. PR83]MCG8914328.1 hypothetical protein [Actinokineospora sp. PR83]